MKELVAISGKGGCGKTTVLASLAALAESVVLADGDVDAPDLHLLLRPEIQQRTPFVAGFRAALDASRCTGCGRCAELCRFEGIRMADSRPVVSELHCEGCGLCVDQCPVQALSLADATCGEWYCSATAYGPMVHARLQPGRPNSGKLVSLVRKEARELAEREGKELILVDGPPGIGCPVIATVGGADLALVVTEPSPSGQHDLRRALELLRHFRVPAWFSVNRADLYPEGAAGIRAEAESLGARWAGDIRYDSAVTASQYEGRPVVLCPDSPAGNDIRAIWHTLQKEL